VIGVRDTGVGIEPRDIPQILNGLTRVKDPYVRGGQGAGLGLPITKSLIELHGGQLAIDSRLGGGTNVQIILPATRVLGPLVN
jgi:two-component system cell cycle sensor histidine kinase PleC